MEEPLVSNTAEVVVDRTAPEGNCFYIMGIVTRMLKTAGRSDLIESYKSEATQGDYDHLCQVSKKYVNIKFIN